MATPISLRNAVFLALCATPSLNCATTAAPAPVPAVPAPVVADSGGWAEMFNGKDLSGWRVNERPETFNVIGGELVVRGDRAHLFYGGPDGNARFTNFEWSCEVLTKAGANSGMYFHTEFQESGWPAKGFEVQVNNTQKDPKKTGGLYAVKDVFDPPARDEEWFTQAIRVEGKRVVIKVNGEVTTDFTEPTPPAPPKGMAGRVLSAGTVAIQGHDPGSEVHYRNCRIRPL